MINKNKLFRQIHIYSSLFFLPAALLYALTGIIYIFGFKENVGMQEQSYIVEKYIEKGKEKDEILNFLHEQGLKIPSNTELKKGKKENVMTMGGVHYAVSITTLGENKYEITARTRSILGDIMLLHKDKGAWYFSIIGVGFGVVLFLLYISGLIITFFTNKKDRNKQFAVFIFGLVITSLLAYLSL